MSFKPSYTKRGFTLIEIIVSLGLFAVVITIVLSAYLSIVDASNKNRTLDRAINNLNFVLDSMAREIRFGSSYHCGSTGALITEPQNCPTGGELYFAFEAVNGSTLSATDQNVYRLQGGQIERSRDSGVTFLPVTSDEITINNLEFFVTGAESDDDVQGTVRIALDGVVAFAGGDTSTSFTLQTAVSERSIPVVMTNTGGGASAFDECDMFPPQLGRTIVDYSNTRTGNTFTLVAETGWFKVSGTKKITPPIPAGVYDISVASFADHSACPETEILPDVDPPDECQDDDNESLRLQLLSYGREIFVTDPTPDVPELTSTSTAITQSNVTITDTITHINPLPGEDPGDATSSYSVTWLCAAFDQVGSPISIEEF